MEESLNVIVGVTGSVASIKLPILIDKLKQLKENGLTLNIKVVATKYSQHFFDKNDIIGKGVIFLTDEDEWSQWQRMSDPVLHIELRKWAHLMVIAPLDANSLAKISQGLCDNLLTCVIRAWDFKKPLLFCPAMNTFMYNNPLTGEAIAKLKLFGFQEIPVVTKKLACGDYGDGAMAEVDTIVNCIKERLNSVVE